MFESNMKNTIEELIISLDGFNKLSLSGIKDETFQNKFENIKSIVSKGSKDIKKNLLLLFKNAEWNSLNVSFFGETNAGKSTLIEALTNGNGKNIGEGYKDFTRDIDIKSYENLHLIDMPGIEGKEHIVINEIEQAVNKSHIVFYVIGSNKEPEENTIQKIKKFLKNNAKVYSIINVRGKPTAYRYKKELKDKNIAIIEQRVKEKFKEILGENYAGNIVLNAHLALLKNNNLEKRFEKDKIKAIEIFKNSKVISEFSNINSLFNLLNRFENTIKYDIFVSNSYKFLTQINSLLSEILREKKDFDISLQEMNKDIEKYKNTIYEIFKKYKSEIKDKININLTSLENKLKKTVNDGIEEDKNEKTLKKEIKQIQTEESKKLNSEIEKLLNDMQEEIKKAIQEFKDRLSLKMKIFEMEGKISVEEILKELEYTIGEVFKEILQVGASIWGVIYAFAINPILGVIAGLVAFVVKIWDWFTGNPNKKKSKAKKESNKKIEESLREIKNNIENDLVYNFDKLNQQTQKPIWGLKGNIKALKSISLTLDEQIKEIQIIQVRVTTLLAREILGDKVGFCYIDLQLSKALIIGIKVNQKTREYLSKLFRVKKIYMYSFYDELWNSAGFFIKRDVLKVKNEFYFRAIKSLKLVDNKLNIRKIIKER